MVFAMGMKEELALALMAGLERQLEEWWKTGSGGRRLGRAGRKLQHVVLFQLQSDGARFGTDSFSLPVALSSKLRGYPAASIRADPGDP